MALPALPSLPPGRPHEPLDGATVLSSRARALRDVLRNDLALRWLAWRAVLVAVAAFGWLFVVGCWATRRVDGADEGFGTGLLALGAPALVVAGSLLVREALRQRRVSRALHAWVAVVDHPAVRSLLARQGADAGAVLERAAVRAQIEQTGGAAPPDAAVRAAWERSAIALRRGVWGMWGGLTLFFGLLYLVLAATGDAVANMSGEDDAVTGTATVAGLGVLCVVSGGRTVWKALRLRSRTHL